jgi:hypothetical protein
MKVDTFGTLYLVSKRQETDLEKETWPHECGSFAHSGENDHPFRAMPITQTGGCRSPFPAHSDHAGADNAGSKIIPLVVVCDQRGMNFSHRLSFQF